MTDPARCPHCNGRLPRRLHFTHPDRGPQSWLAVTAPVVIFGSLIFFTYHTAGIHWPWPSPDTGERLLLGAAGFGFCLLSTGIMISMLYIVVPLLWNWLFPGAGEPAHLDQVGGRMARTGGNQWLYLEQLPDVDHRAFRRWLAGVHYDRRREGGVTVSQESAAGFGLGREEAKACLRWLVDERWYVCERGRYDNQGGGEFTGLGQWALAMLANGEPWETVLAERERLSPSPTPNDDES